MIISKTPYRISFFGGGTDYPAWYREHGGAVLAVTIDKYCYLTVRHLPPFFDHCTRVVYSKVESCFSNDEVAHPAVRAALKHLGITRGLEIHSIADLPARSGIGSSSTFTVGLLNALYALQSERRSAHELALEGIHVEQEILRETVGSQDQVMAAFGGLRHVKFHTSGEIQAAPLAVPEERLGELNSQLMLFYTRIVRSASDVAQTYVADIAAKRQQMTLMSEMVTESINILSGSGKIDAIGHLLHDAWQAKRSLSRQVSTKEIDDIYIAARAAGALGGKILGAGGGGFIMLFAPPDRQAAVRAALDHLVHVPFSFENSGSQIILEHSERESIDSSAETFAIQHQLRTAGLNRAA